MAVFEVRATARNAEMSAADPYGEPKDVETGHAPSLPGMAVEDPRRLVWTPAETYRRMKERDPDAILYLSVCCGREQTHSGPTRYCAFCGRECVGDVYEPSTQDEAGAGGDGVASTAGDQPAGASSTLEPRSKDSGDEIAAAVSEGSE